MKENFTLLILLVCLALAESSTPIVTTKSGQVRGTIEKSFSLKEFFAFRGIPFAQPPTGQLRFKPPVAKEPWEGVYDATDNGPICIQPYQFDETQVLGSEDCLWLNVYTHQVPEKEDDELRPVLVWIHGGRWLVGSGSSKFYNPMFLMDQDLVVVSIQYRLGAYGFLSTNDANAPGNYGLHDQVLALEWVKANIAAFGGNPNKVTLMGQSAGAASSHMHLLSPRSRGLIHGAISLSGSGINYWANRFEGQRQYAERQAYLVDCPVPEPSADTAEMIDCLRRVDPVDLTSTQRHMHDFFGGTPAKLPLSPYGPRTDPEAENPFMPESGLELIRRGEVSSIPLMIGVTSQEGAWMIASFYGQDSGERLKVYEENRVRATSSLTGNFFSKEKIEKIVDFYLGKTPVTELSQRFALSELLSDLKFTFELFMTSYFHARQSLAPVFAFKFDYRGNWTFAHEFEETKHDYGGVAHLDDLRYLFKLVYGPELNEEEVEIMKRYTGFVADFCRYGQPTHGDSSRQYNHHWTPYLKGEGQYMVIDVPSKSGMSRAKPFETSSRPGRMQLWRELFEYPEDLMEDFEVSTQHQEL